MWIVLLAAAFGAHAIDNLDCEFALRDYEVARGEVVRLETNQVVIRGPLEVDDRGAKQARPDWAIRDREGLDRVFANFADSLHLLKPGDRLYLIDADGTVLRSGYYEEVTRLAMLEFENDVLMEGTKVCPTLVAEPGGKDPLITSERLAEMFDEGYPAVVIKTLDDVALMQMRQSLLPQIERYRAHQLDDGRFVPVARGEPPHERLIFETVHRGRLHHQYVDRPPLRSNANHHRLEMVLRGEKDVLTVEPGDTLYLIDRFGGLLSRFEVTGAHPVVVRDVRRAGVVTDLRMAFGRQRQTILFRKVRR